MKECDYCNLMTDLAGGIKIYETLTVNAKPNSEYEIHSHFNEFEIYWFLEGDLYFSFEGQKIEINPGDMVVISNNCLHRPILKKECRYYRKRILFSNELFSKYSSVSYELQHLLLKRKYLKLSREAIKQARLDQLFEDFERELACQKPYNDFCALTILYYFLILAEKVCDSVSDGNAFCSNKAYQITQYIDENIAEDLSYKKLAQHFHISEKSLYKFFKQETGYALGKYIKERRIIKAKSILNAGASAKDAAIAAGFADYSGFYRNFLKETGVTPTQYSKQVIV